MTDKPFVDTPTPRRPGASPKWPLIMGLLVLAGGIAALYYLRAPSTIAPEGEAPAPAPTVATPVVPNLPPPAQTDAQVRVLLAQVSSSPLLKTWLEVTDLLRRFVGTVVAVGRGESPANELGFMAPGSPFRATKKAGRVVVDPRSYARYDAVAKVVGSLDVAACARVYAELKPLLDRAYAELGPKESNMEKMLAQAFARLTATPVPDHPLALVEKGVLYSYADATLEALSPATKHLLRMGPSNMRVIQAKVRELTLALKLPAV